MDEIISWGGNEYLGHDLDGLRALGAQRYKKPTTVRPLALQKHSFKT